MVAVNGKNSKIRKYIPIENKKKAWTTTSTTEDLLVGPFLPHTRNVQSKLHSSWLEPRGMNIFLVDPQKRQRAGKRTVSVFLFDKGSCKFCHSTKGTVIKFLTSLEFKLERVTEGKSYFM